jgi:hypothetical protein
MTHRFCPTCERWLETAEYTVDQSGQTICPTHEISVHGYIGGATFGSYTERDFRRDNQPQIYGEEFTLMLEKAREQRLID